MRGDFAGFGLRPTRFGTVFLVALVVLALAALNTANNALMAVLGLALGSYAVAGAWSRQVLGAVAVDADPVGEVHAGRSARLVVRLHNRSRRFPAYGIVLRDRDRRLLLMEPYLPAGGRRERIVTTRYEDRGRRPIGPWRLEVLLPLGFFVKSKRVVDGGEVLVLPRLLADASAVARRGVGRRVSSAYRGRGREGEVTQLRAFREGDEVRQLHWKQTARQQQLIVVDRERPDDEPLQLVLDPRVRRPRDPRVRDRFERLVSEVATEAVRRLDEGRSVGLVAGARVVPPGRGHRHGLRILRALAEVEPVAADDGERAAGRLAETA